MNDTRLTIENCRKLLGDEDLIDERVVEIRDALYSIAESVFDKHKNTGYTPDIGYNSQ
ncbi:MAG: hypothetical protein NTZ13_01825 [Candidatus Parcubacteria bacterium]|nr:hypothetical protein [Candidatus Parcubacteria bacterium]